MKSMKSVLSILVLPIILTSSAQAQKITLPEFLDLVRQNHPLFEKETLSIEIEKRGREASLGRRDWRIASSPAYLHQTPLTTGSFAPRRLDQLNAGASLEKAIWSTGGRLAVDWTSELTDQEFRFKEISIPLGTETLEIKPGDPTFYQNSFNLTYTQPLFQNFRGELDRLAYDLSQYSVDMAAVQSVENQEQFLLDIGMRYIDWVLLTEQKAIATEQLDLMEQQLEQTRRKREANLVDEVDVLRALDAVRIAEQNVVLMEARWKAKQAELAVLGRSEELYNLSPDFNLYERVDPSALQGASERLREQSRLLQILALRGKQLERQHRGFKEMTKPQLFLRTQLSAKSGDSELGSSLALNKGDAGVFLQFNYPLGNRTARADAEKSRLQVYRHDLEVEDVTLSLEASLLNLLIQMEGIERVLALNEQQIESARLKTNEELKRYNQGRGDLTFVIQSQDNEERARLTYAQNAATYQGLNISLKALMDELLPSTE